MPVEPSPDIANTSGKSCSNASTTWAHPLVVSAFVISPIGCEVHLSHPPPRLLNERNDCLAHLPICCFQRQWTGGHRDHTLSHICNTMGSPELILEPHSDRLWVEPPMARRRIQSGSTHVPNCPELARMYPVCVDPEHRVGCLVQTDASEPGSSSHLIPICIRGLDAPSLRVCLVDQSWHQRRFLLTVLGTCCTNVAIFAERCATRAPTRRRPRTPMHSAIRRGVLRAEEGEFHRSSTPWKLLGWIGLQRVALLDHLVDSSLQLDD